MGQIQAAAGNTAASDGAMVKPGPKRFEMTEADVSAIVDYVFMHARGNPKGRPWSIYCRMMEFLNSESEEPPQMDDALEPWLFDPAQL